MRDLFTEIWESIRRNKLRTCLTGFAVAWGIFMLIVLLGAGNGLKNNMAANMGEIQKNNMTIFPGETSVAFDGLQQGRYIRFTDDDLRLTASDQFKDNIDEVAPIVSASGLTMTNGKTHISISLRGVTPLSNAIRPEKILAGRYINENDLKHEKKAIVLPKNYAERLFGENVTLNSMIGRRVKVDDYSFVVVGIYKTDNSMMDAYVYVPYTTLRTVFAKGNYLDQIIFTFHGLDSEDANEEFETRYRGAVNRRHRAAPDDRSAIWISNSFTQSLTMDKGMGIVTTALWVVGLFTLLSGIVGVSNIMLITVKERTHEFGIRKAIGASPASITKLIIAESVSITAFFGYVGMFLGMIACEYMNKLLSRDIVIVGQQISMSGDTTVGLDVAVEATVVLIIAGTLAGLIPALKAGRVRPIEALRAD